MLQGDCQKRGYVVTADFEYKHDKFGQPYGWGAARYAVPETFFGKDFTKNVYKNTLEKSAEKILKFLSGKLPDIPQKKLEKVIFP